MFAIRLSADAATITACFIRSKGEAECWRCSADTARKRRSVTWGATPKEIIKEEGGRLSDGWGGTYESTKGKNELPHIGNFISVRQRNIPSPQLGFELQFQFFCGGIEQRFRRPYTTIQHQTFLGSPVSNTSCLEMEHDFQAKFWILNSALDLRDVFN